MKKFMYVLLGILTASLIFHSDISHSYVHFSNNVGLFISFSIVTLTSAYAYFFIHKVLQKQQSDE